MKNIYSSLILFTFSFRFASAQVPVANFTASDTTICNYECINYTNLSTNATAWLWSFPGAIPSSSTLQNPGVVCYYGNVGAYDVTLIAINGLNSDTLTKQNYITTFPSPPTPVITWSGDTLSCSQDTSYVSYQWYNNSTLIPSATNWFFIPGFQANYNVKVTNRFGCSIAVGINCCFNISPNIVKGKCFLDYNNNGVRDNGEPDYLNVIVTSSGSGMKASVQPSAGKGFSNHLEATGVVQTTLQNVTSAYTFSPAQHTSNFPGSNYVDSVDFALVPVPGVRNLHVTMLPLSIQRLGRDAIYRINYSHSGTDTVSSGTVYMVKDHRLSMVSSAPAVTSTQGDTLFWSYTNLLPNETRTIQVTLHNPIPPALDLGDTVSCMAVILPLLPSTNPSDHYAYVRDRIIGAYDPNDKTVLFDDHITTQQIADGQYLNYLIRFQNTGNDTAFKVLVKDKLDSKLDETTFSMVSASNSYEVSIDNQKNVSFLFENILLPDSNVNEPASHGYICYRIKPKNGLTAGDLIKNTASIFFDYNSAVITNTCTTTVSSPQPVHEAVGSNERVVLYPNPAKDKFTVYGLPFTVTQFEIVDLPGRVFRKSEIVNRNSDIGIDVSNLPAGLYFLQLKGENGMVVKKFVKE